MNERVNLIVRDIYVLDRSIVDGIQPNQAGSWHAVVTVYLLIAISPVIFRFRPWNIAQIEALGLEMSNQCKIIENHENSNMSYDHLKFLQLFPSKIGTESPVSRGIWMLCNISIRQNVPLIVLYPKPLSYEVVNSIQERILWRKRQFRLISVKFRYGKSRISGNMDLFLHINTSKCSPDSVLP